MQEFLSGISSLYWWLSVVVVGVIINLTSAYLKDPIDKLFSSLSASWSKRSASRRAAIEKRIDSLVGNPHEQVMAAFSEMRDRIRAIQFWTLGLFVFLLAGILKGLMPSGPLDDSHLLKYGEVILLLPAVVAIFQAMMKFNSAVETKEIIFEARKRQRQAKMQDKPVDPPAANAS